MEKNPARPISSSGEQTQQTHRPVRFSWQLGGQRKYHFRVLHVIATAQLRNDSRMRVDLYTFVSLGLISLGALITDGQVGGGGQFQENMFVEILHACVRLHTHSNMRVILYYIGGSTTTIRL